MALGRLFLFRCGNDPIRIAFWARVPILLLGAILIFGIGHWGVAIVGRMPALLGAALAAFCPNLLAHALATEDLACATFTFLATVSFERAMRCDRLWQWAVTGILTGLALLSKHTALLLLPSYVCIHAGAWWSRLERPPLRRAVLALLVVVLGAAVSVGLLYGFDYRAWADSLAAIYQDMRPGSQFYLFGKTDAEPRWYYCLASLLCKAPASTIVLMLWSVVVACRRPRNARPLVYLLCPALVIVTASCFDRQNLGLRRILPALPLLLLFSATVLGGSPGLLRRSCGLILVIASLCEAIVHGPHDLSFVNWVAGGPARGPYLFDDSNVDWGQDLPALREWQQQHPEAVPVRLCYFGSSDPSAYGIAAVPVSLDELRHPEHGYYAVSVTRLVQIRKLLHQGVPGTDWLSQHVPVGRAGWSIWIYRF
ncbi:MAG: glycosyltransferase family 39 protein [Planctomycetota bacterium]